MRSNRFMFKFIAIALVSLLAVFLIAATPYENYEYKAILPDTPIYVDTDISSEIVGQIPQNAKVEILSDPINIDGKVWVKVSYTIYQGYLEIDSIYCSMSNDNYTVKPVKIKSKNGKDVALYATHTEGVEAVGTVHDGEKVRLIQDGIDYGNFSYIEYKGEFYYVNSNNITEGLGYNQSLAVYISLGFVLLIAAVLAIIAIKKKKSIN